MTPATDAGKGSAAATFQDQVDRLATVPDDGERGLRFCFGREANDHTGIFLSWPRILRRIDGCVRRFSEAGLRHGDVVAVHCHDQQTALLAILAAIRMGAIPAALAPVGAGSAERLLVQFHAVLRVADTRLLVCDRDPDEVVRIGGELPPILVLDRLDEAEPQPRLQRARAEDPCFIQFTSGSTSTPKGVVVTHRMLVANLDAIADVIGWDERGRCVGWLPIYHDMSLVGMYSMVVSRAARGCFFPTTRFGRSPDLWLRLIAEERAHFSAGPNFAFAMINRMHARRPIAGIDLRDLRGILCGSEPIAAEVMRTFAMITRNLGCDQPVIPAFGMAESTLMASSARPGDALETLRVERAALEGQGRVVQADAQPGPNGMASSTLELVACGPAAPGIRIVIDREGSFVGEDRVGEVLLGGSSVLERYWRNAEATAAAFIDRDGQSWFRTGDLGFLHAGQLFICGRAKDVIIHNGVNHYPADVEVALQTQLAGDIRLAAVVDLRQDLAEVFQGLGVLGESGHAADAESTVRIASFVKAYTDLPVACVHLLPPGEHLPRTTSGKLVRSEIRRTLLKLDGRG